MRKFKRWIEGGALALAQTIAICVLFVGIPAPKAEALPSFPPKSWTERGYYGYVDSTCSGHYRERGITLTDLLEAGAAYYTVGAPAAGNPGLECKAIPDFNSGACKSAVALALNVSALAIMFVHPRAGGVLLVALNTPVFVGEEWTSGTITVAETICRP